MKTIKRFFLLVLTIFLAVILYNYPKLNIIAGYSAKNTASSVFVADRSLTFTDVNDNAFSPINLAKDEVNSNEKSAISSVFGLLTRTAFNREGLGSVLALDKDDINKTYLKPKRTQPNTTTPFPYGNLEPKDSVFTTIGYKTLDSTFDVLFDSINKTRAALVIYKDHIVAERYAEGFTKKSKILGWSMTKSITSTLFGILQTQGKINVQDKAPIEEWKNDERSNITIHNLLQMNSGLAWVEDYNTISDVSKMLFLERDMTQQQIDKSFAGKPNETWNYSSGTTNLLSGILRQQFKTHQEYLDFWYTALIDKIGMNSMLIETDLAGNYVGSSYGWATPRDWAKLGLLYLKNGTWKGEQLFTKEWVDYATTPTPNSDGWYGAQIWLNAGNRYPDVPKNMYFFSGYQGQNVYILPDEELVIVRMGLTKNADVNEFIKGVLSSIK
ncbi:CubicO group peptidase (beta-lactamase class C family) [Lutibacter sp. Hel_I_33_5]|uniref:serine hydrolase domain-containing protein n=1 Tax=Lutibacter sp. Hel_I_33_5 TaxID=1566289 RepID=UPI0011A9D824|nr:serine hydrolase [Lutibacter sp. Hel_I_33_5]TVZ56417.1 CubicO group peptidase (beta-lactamase class C family) [Lutibacter sp. Hel_I_33_5]